MSKKLFIIGNGFDLQCGLESSFDSFYWYYFNKYILPITHSYEIYDVLRFMPYDSNFFYLLLMIVLEQDGAYNDVKQLLGFDAHKYNSNWADIEFIIKQFLRYKPDKAETSIYDIVEDFYYNGKIINVENAEINGITLLQLYMSYQGKRNSYSYNNKVSFEDFLFTQLHKFESIFSEYLSSLVNDEVYKEKVSLLKHKLEITFEDKIINFNYTHLIDPARRSGLETNVHGSLEHKDIIIGIDRTSLGGTTNRGLRFTKTFRKLANYKKVDNLTLVDGIREIVFYGHSLGEQDYSYFQSIFDTYNIYSENIKLTFCYSDNFGDQPNETDIESIKRKQKIKEELSARIFKMINKYGDTFPNKGNGQNLLHKLILENRIELKVVNL